MTHAIAARRDRPSHPEAARLRRTRCASSRCRSSCSGSFVAVVVNVIAPQLEVVGELHSAPMAPEDAPSMKAMKLMGGNFKEFDSNSTIMVVIEGQQPLGPDAHDYYDEIIQKLQQDPEHIQHIQDFWGDTLTAAGAQSADGKAVLRDDQPGGRAGPDPGQRRRRRRPQGHRGHQGPAGRAGLRRRPGRAHRRPARHRQRQPGPDHPDHPRSRSRSCCWSSTARSAPR